MPEGTTQPPGLDPAKSPGLDPAKFKDPHLTARGEARAHVALAALETLWLNTGSLCNITCDHCYMDSSPKNDRLAYLTLAEAEAFFDEIQATGLPTAEIGLTGGEPFMNRETIAIIESALGRGFRVLVLTNAMKPLWNKRDRLLAMRGRLGAGVTDENLTLRVSIDHHTAARHEHLRGPDTWAPMMRGLKWLAGEGFRINVAGRTCWDEDEAAERAAYAGLFAREGLALDAANPAELVLFPEMDAARDVPEITTGCWSILNVRPDAMMCATSRMVVRRKGDRGPRVVPCTLLPYDAAFDMGTTLQDAAGDVSLNHPHCAAFCVLGGASCSAG